MNSKEKLNKTDFAEAVILKVRQYEKRHKQKRLAMFSMAVIGFISYSTVNLIKPPEKEYKYAVRGNDEITRELLNQHDMNHEYSANYAFNAGKMELCLKYLKCNDG